MSPSFDGRIDQPRTVSIDLPTARAVFMALAVLFPGESVARGPEGESFAEMATLPPSCSAVDGDRSECRRGVDELVTGLKEKIASGVLSKAAPSLIAKTKTTERCVLAADILEKQAPEIEKIITFVEFLLGNSEEQAKKLREDEHLLKGVVAAFKREHGGREPSAKELTDRMRGNLSWAPETLRQCSGILYGALETAFIWGVAGTTQKAIATRLNAAIDLINTDLQTNAGGSLERLLPAARALDGILNVLKAAALQK